MSNSGKKLKVLSDFPLPKHWERDGDAWEAEYTRDFALSEVCRADLLVVNGRVDILKKLAMYAVLHPNSRKPLIAVDVVLRRPTSRLKAFGLRAIFRRVDHFLHYFRDLDAYERFYGIGYDRSEYIPFKANLRYRHTAEQRPGEYVLCFGESMRDFATFLQAMSGLPIPGAISERAVAMIKKEGCSVSVPANVRVLQDDRSQDAQIRIMEDARIVAVPVKQGNICASGIGTYLNSMLLGKAVILTSGPGVSDVLTDGQAMIVPPADPNLLRSAITTLWNDDSLRAKYVEAGRRYAESLGGEPELYNRIIDAAMHWYYKSYA